MKNKKIKFRRSFINIYILPAWLVIEFEISNEYGIRIRIGRISIILFSKLYLPPYEE